MTTEAAHWGYTGAEGPERWGCLSDDYRACSEGVHQSPVDISRAESHDGPAIGFEYSAPAATARNNGHTVYLDFAPGNFLGVADRRYELIGVHYHSPAEHEIGGEQFAAELHLVHQDTDGNLAVVGLLYQVGRRQSFGAAPAGCSAGHGRGPPIVGWVLSVRVRSEPVGLLWLRRLPDHSALLRGRALDRDSVSWERCPKSRWWHCRLLPVATTIAPYNPSVRGQSSPSARDSRSPFGSPGRLDTRDAVGPSRHQVAKAFRPAPDAPSSVKWLRRSRRVVRRWVLPLRTTP